MALFLYRLIVAGYGLVIQLAAIGNHKARQWRSGRRAWRATVSVATEQLKEGKRVWFHCASYGEFEQGRPLMEELKKREPDTQIILSFFSPSGFLPMKDWQGADLICYLPLDTPANARDFLDIIQPQTIFFIKYEYWLFFLGEIRNRKLPAFLVSATFKIHQPFFKWYGEIFRHSLTSFRLLFVQDQPSCELLKKVGIRHFILSGDTRVDRVLKIRETFEGISGLDKFKGNSRLLIAGSTWPKDEDLLIAAFLLLRNENIKLIIAPHNIHPSLQQETCTKLKRLKINYSRYSTGIDEAASVLVLDTMGLLSRVYAYADLAYVGGGFDQGIHNILEPAVYGIPVCIGGKGHEKFNEAVSLQSRGDLHVVQNPAELSKYVSQCLNDVLLLSKIKNDLAAYFQQNSRVTERILRSI